MPLGRSYRLTSVNPAAWEVPVILLRSLAHWLTPLRGRSAPLLRHPAAWEVPGPLLLAWDLQYSCAFFFVVKAEPWLRACVPQREWWAGHALANPRGSLTSASTPCTARLPLVLGHSCSCTQQPRVMRSHE